MNIRVILGAVFFLCQLVGSSQIKRDSWRDHFSYNNCIAVSDGDNYVFAATDVAVILYEKSTESIIRFNKTNGLSDVGITAISALNENMFIIGYSNGNIDFISNNKVINLPDLKNKNIQGSKKINSFSQHGNLVYCSLDFGILVLNIEKLEVADTYYLGDGNQDFVINQTQLDDRYIYAASDKGLYRAEISNPSLGYFESWTEISGTTEPFLAVDFIGDQLVYVRKSSSNKYIVAIGDQGAWTEKLSLSSFRNFFSRENYLYISEINKLVKYTSDLVSVEIIDSYSIDSQSDVVPNISMVTMSESENTFYFSDIQLGFIKKSIPLDVKLVPNGPFSNNCFALHATPSGIYSLAGGLTSSYNNLNRNVEYSFYSDQQWSYYRSNKRGDEKYWRDLIRMCSDPFNKDHVYMSSWGAGVFEANGTELDSHFDQHNSGLQNIDWAGPNYVRVGGIAADSHGNVWMSNSEVANGIVVKSADDKWYQYNYGILNNLHGTDQFLITNDGLVWIIIPRTERKGLVVINPNGTPLDQSDDVYRGPVSKDAEKDTRNDGLLKIWDEKGDIITNSIVCMAEDKDGYLWLGTDQGVVVYYRPWNIFEENFPIASRIKVPFNDGTNSAGYLLDNNKVTSIVVDGANRKWLGTEGAGIYLVSEDGTKTIHSFNKENSPLPSDNISSISIMESTGEVFIGTDKGIVSYKSNAIEPVTSLCKVYAYPNPVREDFSGPITITGLVLNSNVKITNVSGKLVYETRSLGGQVQWDGQNLWGEKVRSGVYIVYVSSEDGSDTQSTKILIVR
ncbi:MAG: T9SS type A sorting domain-containing protein [Marinilabiliaceae bacterium]|nr:T9SS type A sorting domain-containing protein [Marinilabiliaceae bacterium]